MNTRYVSFASSLMSLVAALLALTFGVGPAAANSVVLTDTTGATWRVTWSNKITLDIAPIAGANRTQPNYTITKTVDWTKTLNPSDVTITFMQLTAPTLADPFGLRVTVNENITNDTGSPWRGYTNKLVEDPAFPVTATDQTDFPAGSDHPWFAHWHGGTVSAPFVFAFNGKSSLSSFPSPGADASAILPMGGTPLGGNGQIFTYTGLGLHEWSFSDTDPPKGKGRKFSLVEAFVIPEPSSLILLALGAVGVLGYCRRRGGSAIWRAAGRP